MYIIQNSKRDKSGRSYLDYSFEEYIPLDVSTCLYENKRDYFCFKIMRSNGSLCAYIGVLKEDPFYEIDYDNIDDIYVHGGFTFAEYSYEYLGEGYYWIGWDYNHHGDANFYNKISHNGLNGYEVGYSRGWTIKDVLEDSKEVLKIFELQNKIYSDNNQAILHSRHNNQYIRNVCEVKLKGKMK